MSESHEKTGVIESGWTLGLCWGSVPLGGLFDVAHAAAEADLGVVAVTAGHVAQALESTPAARVRERLAGLDIRVGVIDPLIVALPGTPDPGTVDASRRHFFTYTEDLCCRAAEAVGARTINLAHYLGTPTPREALREAVAAVSERLHARGFATSMEFLPGSGVPDLAAALDVVSDAPYAGVMFDTWHFARTGGTLADLEALQPGVIAGLQLSDHRPLEPGQRLAPMSGRYAPGDGTQPLAEIVALLARSTPGLDVCLEVFSDELQQQGLRAAVRRMADGGRRVLADAASIVRETESV